jgi:NADH:ubiquinone reductase (H+-translocating)
MAESQIRQHVVIIGGGFGGLYTAKALGNTDFEVTLIDKRNFHLFQPLLYQVATGTLSPADISSPLRSILSKYKNVRVLMDEAIDIDPQARRVVLKSQELSYDKLVVATGASHHYFGNEHWKAVAPGLKTIEDAIEMRRRIFSAFEAAEKETDPVLRKPWLTFVVVGAGPAGVELAGAIAEAAFQTMKDDFYHIDPQEAEIVLLEGLDRVLPPYPADLSEQAHAALEKLGVTVRSSTRVTNIVEGEVTILQNGETEIIPAKTILWAAGVKASDLGQVLEEKAGASRDRIGRVIVEADLSLATHPEIFVLGDLANYSHQADKPLPGVAAVAMQQGDFLAELLDKRNRDEPLPAFKYMDLGSMAVIGHNEAIVDMGFIKFSGFFAWLAWVVVHIYFLIEFDNKLVVMIQWAWNYFTRNRGARIITGTDLRNLEAEEPVPALIGK